MTQRIGTAEARLSLGAIDRHRDDVATQINVPGWYWPTMAAGWVGIGAVGQFGPAWVSAAVTVAFGAAHATVAPRALSGRHASQRLSVSRDLADRHIPLYVIGFLFAMVAVTVAIALVLNADGSRHPTLLAGAIVALLILTSGPQLMRLVRRRALRVRHG